MTLAIVGFGLLTGAAAYAQARGNQPAQSGSVQNPPGQKPAPPTGQPNGRGGTDGSRPANPAPGGPNVPAGVTPPPDYVIGPDDVLSIVYWREKDLSSDVTVRPDGMISLPLLNDIQAAGLTPAQLHDRLTEAAKKYVEDPNVTVVVHEIKSRKVFITGQVGSPGEYPLLAPTTVVQLIAIAGGLGEYANGKKIVILRNENGRQVTYPFNYRDVMDRKNLRQNIELKPGDTVIIP